MNFDFVILVDSFKPKINSAAVMIEELAKFLSIDSKVCVITESNKLKYFYSFDQITPNFFVLRLKTLKRSKFNIIRGVVEIINPYLMLFIFKLFKFSNTINSKKFIWYSPSIFYSPFIKFFKRKNNAKTYLILRDIFPLWMVDVGLIKKNSLYHILLKYFEKRQYNLADTIGVQINTNIKIVEDVTNSNSHIHVLNNWKLLNKNLIKKPISTPLKSIYAGNIGIAQGEKNFDHIINLASKKNFKISFYSEDKMYKNLVKKFQKLEHISFYETVTNKKLENIYNDCDFGIVLLDKFHKTHNIPGKFISYVSNGLPVFCILNNYNPLIDIINKNYLGIATSDISDSNLEKCWEEFEHLIYNNDLSLNCHNYAQENYDVSSIAKRIKLKFDEL